MSLALFIASALVVAILVVLYKLDNNEGLKDPWYRHYPKGRPAPYLDRIGPNGYRERCSVPLVAQLRVGVGDLGFDETHNGYCHGKMLVKIGPDWFWVEVPFLDRFKSPAKRLANFQNKLKAMGGV